ncbi:MAG: 2-hydroxyacyl-CoA dehydratase family protein [Acidaminococcales bacterium]|jgi:benzoyl-CoA reductase/2-hydroxyglutaryl-CoA dehydratase subunit BcrC/BadD/HgdB|nr:2-hydroxyacyl-CoA dehydratase family protein [Acidaminococcales bacterium]
MDSAKTDGFQKDYLSYNKKLHDYSPAVKKILNLVASYIPDAEKAHANGRQAVWCHTYNWEPLFLYSLDAIPAGYTEMGRYSTMDEMLIAEDYYQFPAETCSMVKCTVGQWHLRQGGGIKKILGGSSNCEPYNLSWEIMRREGYDVFNYDVLYRAPSVTGIRLQELANFFAEQLYDVAEWLTGKREIDEEKLRGEILRSNRLIKKVKKILDLRVQHPFYIRSLPTILMLNVGVSNYFGKPDEFEDAVDLLLAELENQPVNESELKRVIPLVWGGGTGQEFGLYEAIDQSNGALLGFRSIPKLYDETLPPIQSLINYVYNSQRAGASVYARDFIEAEVERLKAKGIIFYGYLGCSFASVDRELWRKYFHEKGIPSISLEGSFQVGNPSGQVLTRIKAFVEMLA